MVSSCRFVWHVSAMYVQQNESAWFWCTIFCVHGSKLNLKLCIQVGDICLSFVPVENKIITDTPLFCLASVLFCLLLNNA